MNMYVCMKVRIYECMCKEISREKLKQIRKVRQIIIDDERGGFLDGDERVILFLMPIINRSL